VHRAYFFSRTFSAGVLRTDDGQFVRLRGKLCAAEGDLLTLVGVWKKHGLQFHAEQLVYDLPETREGLMQYLGHVRRESKVGQ
jgi:hypothetical protein